MKVRLNRNSSAHPVDGVVQLLWEEWRTGEGAQFQGNVDMSALWVAFLGGWESGQVAYAKAMQEKHNGS